MNAKSVTELGECVLRAMKTAQTPAGIAMAVEAEVVEPLRVDLERTRAESRMYRDQLWTERNIRWDSEVPPGGMVCADPECGQPVESEPCREHNPRAVAERLRAKLAKSAAQVSGLEDDLAAALGRSGLDWSELIDVATTAMRRAQLLGDPTLAVHSCVRPTHPKWIAARTDRRGCPWCRLAAVERMRQPVGRTVYLADYDGAEDGPKLFASLDAAQAWVAEWSVGDGPWDWFERDGVHEQWRTDPDSDRPTRKGAGTVTPLELAAAASTVWRAWYSGDGAGLGHYTGRDAAMNRVHHELAREETVSVEAIQERVTWRADSPEEDVETSWECWLVDEDGEDDKPTDYVVSPIEVAAAYDPDGDA